MTKTKTKLTIYLLFPQAKFLEIKPRLDERRRTAAEFYIFANN